MRLRFLTGAGALFALAAVVGFTAGGCNQGTDEKVAQAPAGGADSAADQHDDADEHEEEGSLHNYAGRDWCGEHGVPESECGLCDDDVAAAFKEQGDWCEKHDRPDSQCFICHPELKEKFAADYRAKYGEDPPPMEDEEGELDHEDHEHDDTSNS